MLDSSLMVLIGLFVYSVVVWGACKAKKAYRAKKRLKQNGYFVEFY